MEALIFHLNFYCTQKQEDDKYETNIFLNKGRFKELYMWNTISEEINYVTQSTKGEQNQFIYWVYHLKEIS